LQPHRSQTFKLSSDPLFVDKVRDIVGLYPWIVEAARKIRKASFILDGEAVVLGVDGISDFDALMSRQHDHEVQFCAFDLMMEDGEDMRAPALHLRKTNLPCAPA